MPPCQLMLLKGINIFFYFMGQTYDFNPKMMEGLKS